MIPGDLVVTVTADVDRLFFAELQRALFAVTLDLELTLMRQDRRRLGVPLLRVTM